MMNGKLDITGISDNFIFLLFKLKLWKQDLKKKILFHSGSDFLKKKFHDNFCQYFLHENW